MCICVRFLLNILLANILFLAVELLKDDEKGEGKNGRKKAGNQGNKVCMFFLIILYF